MKSPILTKHARERLHQRRISEDAIASVLSKPERTEPGAKPDTVKFIRTLNGRTIHAVGTYLKDQDRWLIVSVWVRGEDDAAPLMWQILTLPFKLIWKFLMFFFKKNTRH